MSRAHEACASALQRRFGESVVCGVVPVHGDPAGLWPAERALVARAVPARLREFAAGRACARALLARLGFQPAALLRAADRSPLWPSGAVGSIAHDGSLCVVAVARVGRLGSLGLDVEPDEPLEEDLWPELFRARELGSLALWPRRARGRTARVLFSAKECVYKCTRAIVRGTLGFQEVEVEFVPGSDRFTARLHRPAACAPRDLVLEGFHFARAGSILTGMTLAPGTGGAGS